MKGDSPAVERLDLRVTPEQKLKYKLAAVKAKLKLAEWIKGTLDNEADK